MWNLRRLQLFPKKINVLGLKNKMLYKFMNVSTYHLFKALIRMVMVMVMQVGFGCSECCLCLNPELVLQNANSKGYRLLKVYLLPCHGDILHIFPSSSLAIHPNTPCVLLDLRCSFERYRPFLGLPVTENTSKTKASSSASDLSTVMMIVRDAMTRKCTYKIS